MGIQSILAENMLKAVIGAPVTVFSTVVALHTDDPASGNELSGNGYSRQAVAAGGWTNEHDSTGNKQRLKNAAEINFGDPTAQWSPMWIGVWNGTPGASNLLAKQQISPGTLEAAVNKVFAPIGALKFELTVD